LAESIRITLVALFFFRMCVGGRFTGEIGFDTLLEKVIMIIQLYLSGTVKYMKQFWAEIAARVHICSRYLRRKTESILQYISCELRDAYQNAYQTCTFSSTLVLPWFYLGSISLYLTAINPFLTSTYKRESRTVDPKVEGSSPFGLVS